MIAKTQEEIEHLRTSGKILSDTLKALALLTKPGVTTAELDLAAEKIIRERGGIPAFLGYKPSGAKHPFPAALCASVNDEVVHTIPSEQTVLKEGDIISLDLGVNYKGYFSDSAITVSVGKCDAAGQKLIAATREALAAGLATIHPGAHTGDIGAAVAAVAARNRLSVVEELGGHALGKVVHEKPFIANFGTAGQGEKLVEGHVLAIEPIFAEGAGAIALDRGDGWTYRTRDHSRAAHFEQTILVTRDGIEILTPF